MESQATLWLYPLLFLSVFSAVVYARLGFRWGWPGFVQALFILGIAIAGFVRGPAWIYALLGWVLFLLRGMIPLYLLKRITRSIMLLNPEQAVKDAFKLRIVLWGTAGRFWVDMCRANLYFGTGRAEEARALLRAWQGMSMPRNNQETLQRVELMGLLIEKDWDSIIESFEASKNDGTVPFSIATMGSRAFAEKGMLKESLESLKLANVEAIRLNDETRDTVFVSFFSLAGASDDLSKLLAGLNGFPEYVKLYWQARCCLVQHRLSEARQTLGQSLILARKAGIKTWETRINDQIQDLNHLLPADGTRGSRENCQADDGQAVKSRLQVSPESNLACPPDWSAEIAQASDILCQARLISAIVSPRRKCWAVWLLLILISLAYAISHCYSFFKSKESLDLTLSCFRWGLLDNGLVFAHAQSWRLISHLFLHAHLSHLALNLVGLWWFGRLTENLYGGFRFLLIYFFSGILSGLLQITLAPDVMAIGASGAVMGAFGAAAAGIFRCRNILPASIARSELSWMLGLAIVQIIFDQLVPNIAAFAHMGGLLSGFLAGLIVPLRKPEEKLAAV